MKILMPGCRGSASLGGRKPLLMRLLLQRQQLPRDALLRVNKPLALQVPEGLKKGCCILQSVCSFEKEEKIIKDSRSDITADQYSIKNTSYAESSHC